MAYNNTGIDGNNRRLANVNTSGGSIAQLGGFIIPAGRPSNFAVSGGIDPYYRLAPIHSMLTVAIGRYPIIILHNHDLQLESIVYDAWNRVFENVVNDKRTPIWILNQDNRWLEPFYNMPEMQVISAIRQFAKKLDYTPTPKLDRVVRAHLRVLKELNIPTSLSGLYYLTQFQDMGEFHGNILSLPCGEAEGKLIWAEMGADSDDGNNQFDLFRTVINTFASEALQSAWNSDNSVAEINLQSAFNSCGVLTLSINDMYSDLLLNYIHEEMRTSLGRQYLLIIDNLRITDDRFIDFLRQANSNCSLGIVGESVVDMFGDDEVFQKIAERMNLFVILKHSTGKTAERLSELFGKYDRTKIEQSSGSSRGFLSILPRDRHKDIRYTTENAYRVMPEDIIGLGPEQAIIFETNSDRIIYYN